MKRAKGRGTRRKLQVSRPRGNRQMIERIINQCGEVSPGKKLLTTRVADERGHCLRSMRLNNRTHTCVTCEKSKSSTIRKKMNVHFGTYRPWEKANKNYSIYTCVIYWLSTWNAFSRKMEFTFSLSLKRSLLKYRE